MTVAERSERIVEPGLEYAPGDPVRVRVVHREPRTTMTDDGAAVARAGTVAGWQEAARTVMREVDVNISRHGVVSLPVVAVGPPEAEVVRRVGAASLALYQELAELAR